MRRKSYFFNLFIVVLSAMILSSCGIGKMAKLYPEVKYTVTPSVLENNGGKVAVNIKGEFPAKYFNKRAVMVYQPYIKTPDGKKELKPIVLKGEKVKGDGIVIPFKTGGSFSYSDVVAFDKTMVASDLEVSPVAFKAKGKEEAKNTMKASEAAAHPKPLLLADRKLSDGVINTCNKVAHNEDVLIADKKEVTTYIKGTDKDFYEKETIITKGGAKIFFVVDRFNLDLNLKLNKAAQAKADLDSVKAFLNKNWTLKTLNIDAWASPEGEESRNQGLSENRSKTGHDYLEKFFKDTRAEYMKKNKIKAKDMPAAAVVPYAVAPHGEDWNGFEKAIAASDIKDKNTILNVVRSQPDATKREQEIRNMTVIYKEIEENILPPLRRTEITVSSYLPKKTDATIARLALEKPDSLDQKEMLYAASLTADINTQYKIYKNLTKYFPGDWKGFNNVAFVGLKQGNLDEAKEFITKANTLSPNNPIVLNNMGALAAKNLDYAGAKGYYKASTDLGVNTDYNNGIITITEGDYKKAIGQLSAKKCNENLGLAQMLAGNNTEAGTNLSCATDGADKYYLSAILGARTQNQNMVIDNLRKACKEKAALKAVAAQDREFLKFFSNADFQSIVK
ncbi:MAG: hypothetical protein WCO63_00260 [Bacteroidota bacterium]